MKKNLLYDDGFYIFYFWQQQERDKRRMMRERLKKLQKQIYIYEVKSKTQQDTLITNRHRSIVCSEITYIVSKQQPIRHRDVCIKPKEFLQHGNQVSFHNKKLYYFLLEKSMFVENYNKVVNFQMNA